MRFYEISLFIARRRTYLVIGFPCRFTMQLLSEYNDIVTARVYTHDSVVFNGYVPLRGFQTVLSKRNGNLFLNAMDIFKDFVYNRRNVLIRWYS